MNIWVVPTFWLLWMLDFLLLIMLGKCLGAGQNMIIPCLAFWETTKLFSIVGVPFYISIRNVWGFQFFSIFTNTFFVLLIVTILIGIKWFCLHFPNDQWCLESFHVLILYLYFWRNVYSSPIFFRLNYLFIVGLY